LGERGRPLEKKKITPDRPKGGVVLGEKKKRRRKKAAKKRKRIVNGPS